MEAKNKYGYSPEQVRFPLIQCTFPWIFDNCSFMELNNSMQVDDIVEDTTIWEQYKCL